LLDVLDKMGDNNMTYEEYTGNSPYLCPYRDEELVWAIGMEVADSSLESVREDIIDYILEPDDKERNKKVLSGSEFALREFVLQSIKYSLRYEEDIDNFIMSTKGWMRQQND
tara:strand:+ start:270 stop:605 length:336 start_codon:yes stop_codon:yes gene_type:complete